jgi:hypothetical protein
LRPRDLNLRLTLSTVDLEVEAVPFKNALNR